MASVLRSLRAAHSVTLAWDANSEPDIASYVLRYGTTRGVPSQFIPVGSKTTATVSNLAHSKTYYFTVVARNERGFESPPSNEVSYTTPPLGSHKLTVINGSGSGYYTEGTLVPVSGNQPEKGQQFERWVRDYQILLDPTNTRTKALMLFRDLTIEAAYIAANGPDKIRYHPRIGWAARMAGGTFEGTNGNPVTGTYTPIYTIRFNPPPGWSEVSVNLGNFRYLRYRGPNGSYGNVAEIEFHRNGVKVTGTGYGTPGSWNGNRNTFPMALDGNVRLDSTDRRLTGSTWASTPHRRQRIRSLASSRNTLSFARQSLRSAAATNETSAFQRHQKNQFNDKS